MTKEEIAWVAGLLEGEACFDFCKKPKGKSYPRIRVEMKDEDIILRLHKLLGGNVRKSAPRKDKPNWSQYYMLRVCSKEDVKPVLEAILPLLGKRRAAKVQQLLKLYE